MTIKFMISILFVLLHLDAVYSFESVLRQQAEGICNSAEYVSERNNYGRTFLVQILADKFGVAREDISDPVKRRLIRGYQLMEKRDRNDINLFDPFGMAPMHYLAATADGDPNAVKALYSLLIKLGADIRLPNKYGVRPIELAAQYGNFPFVQSYLESGHVLPNGITLLMRMFSEKSDVTLLYGCNGIIFGRASILGEVMKAQGIESASLRGHAERLKKLIRLNLNDDLRIREIKRCSNEVYDELGRIKQAGKKRKTETERADSWAIIEEQARAMLEVLPTDA